MQWGKDGCFQLEDPDGTCKDMYDLGEGETLRLNKDQNLKDLIKVKCIGAAVRCTLAYDVSTEKYYVFSTGVEAPLSTVLSMLMMGHALGEGDPLRWR